MVETAVRFLKNPKVVDSPLSRKVTFLENKGLTAAEVAAALARADGGLSYPAAVSASTPPPVLAAGPPPLPPPPPPRTIRELLASTALVAGGCFLAYKAFTTYVLPRIEWPVNEELQGRLQTLTESVARLESAQRTQSEQVQQRLARVETDTTIGDIRSEIASLRTLLLGRGQFPAAPAPVWPASSPATRPPTTPAIPKWQLARAKPGEDGVDASAAPVRPADLAAAADGIGGGAEGGDATTSTTGAAPATAAPLSASAPAAVTVSTVGVGLRLGAGVEGVVGDDGRGAGATLEGSGEQEEAEEA